jgi:hypothetical protein
MPVRRVDPPDDLGAERLRRKDGLDVDANHSPVRTQRGGGIRLGSRNGGRRLHTILGSSEGQPSTRLTEAGYAVSRRVDEGGAGRRSHRRGPRTSTWPSDRPPGHNSGTTMGGYKPVTAADCAGHAQDGSGRREGRSRIPQPQVKRTNPWPRPGVLQSGRRDSNPRPSPWQGRSYCCVRRHLCKQTAFPEQGRCSWAQIPGTKLPPSGPVPVRDALSRPMSSHNRPLGGPRSCAGTHQAHQTPPPRASTWSSRAPSGSASGSGGSTTTINSGSSSAAPPWQHRPVASIRSRQITHQRVGPEVEPI